MTIPTCSTWQYYANPVPQWATTEAVRILAAWNAGAVNPDTGKPYELGDAVYETGGDGRQVRYLLRMHPPDPQNPAEHHGVEVQFCADESPSPSPPPPPSTGTWSLEGVDVSDAQGTIDWSRVAASGVAFAFIKATEGLPGACRTPQATFATNWKAAPAAGVVVGAYHYFRPSQDPIAQAKHHASVVGALSPGDIGPALDCEHSDDVEDASNYAPEHYGPAVIAYLKTIAQLTGKRPIIYVSRDTWGTLVTAADARTIASLADLWVAQWPSPVPASGTPAPTTGAWSSAFFWQYESGDTTGRVDGVAGGVDRDRFVGSLADLARYVAAGAKPTPVPVPPKPTPPRGGGGVSGLFRAGAPRDGVR